MTDTLMTETAATPNEGQPASQPAESLLTEGQPAPGGEQSATTQQATEGQAQPAADQGGDAGKTDGEQAKPEGAPETYEFKAPEGAAFDDHVIGQFSEVAKELNLSQEAAQKVLDKIAPALAEKQSRMIESVRTEWAESARADKEFGGQKLSENLAVAQKALNQFGTPELRALLNESGLGNHPEIIRAFYRAGKAISEDGFVPGGRSAAPADPAKRMFPNMA